MSKTYNIAAFLTGRAPMWLRYDHVPNRKNLDDFQLVSARNEATEMDLAAAMWALRAWCYDTDKIAEEAGDDIQYAIVESTLELGACCTRCADLQDTVHDLNRQVESLQLIVEEARMVLALISVGHDEVAQTHGPLLDHLLLSPDCENTLASIMLLGGQAVQRAMQDAIDISGSGSAVDFLLGLPDLVREHKNATERTIIAKAARATYGDISPLTKDQIRELLGGNNKVDERVDAAMKSSMDAVDDCDTDVVSGTWLVTTRATREGAAISVGVIDDARGLLSVRMGRVASDCSVPITKFALSPEAGLHLATMLLDAILRGQYLRKGAPAIPGAIGEILNRGKEAQTEEMPASEKIQTPLWPHEQIKLEWSERTWINEVTGTGMRVCDEVRAAAEMGYVAAHRDLHRPQEGAFPIALFAATKNGTQLEFRSVDVFTEETNAYWYADKLVMPLYYIPWSDEVKQVELRKLYDAQLKESPSVLNKRGYTDKALEGSHYWESEFRHEGHRTWVSEVRCMEKLGYRLLRTDYTVQPAHVLKAMNMEHSCTTPILCVDYDTAAPLTEMPCALGDSSLASHGPVYFKVLD